MARWVVKKEEIKIFSEISDDIILINSITRWRQKLQMPKFVTLDDGDNELFINLENALSARTLFSIVNKRISFILEEFLFDPNNAILKSNEGAFTNEFIISFYKNN